MRTKLFYLLYTLLILALPQQGRCDEYYAASPQSYIQETEAYKKIQNLFQFQVAFQSQDLRTNTVSLKLHPENSSANLQYMGTFEANVKMSTEKQELILQLKKQIHPQMYLAINHEENDQFGTHNNLALSWDF